jgi:adenylate kinase
VKAAGKLVDDAIVLGMIQERLAEPVVARGFILDGFPRNIAQAEALDVMLRLLGKPLTAVVQMEVPYVELTRRIAGRRSCQNCGRVYNIYSMPVGAALVCPKCPGNPPLFQRPDDNEATVVERLKVYEAQTRPLVDYYGKQGLLQSIDAQDSVDAITDLLVGVLTSPAVRRASVVGRSKAKPKAKAKAKAKAKSKARAKPVPKSKSKQKPKSKSKPKSKAKSKARNSKPATVKRRPAAKKAKKKPARKQKKSARRKK